eukprot:6173242-Pleurochrysis_carterae.AAC.3
MAEVTEPSDSGSGAVGMVAQLEWFFLKARTIYEYTGAVDSTCFDLPAGILMRIRNRHYRNEYRDNMKDPSRYDM